MDRAEAIDPCLSTAEACALYHLGKLSEYLQGRDMVQPLRELCREPEPVADLERAVRDVPLFRTKSWPSVFQLGLFRIVNYVLARELQPAVFMETGVLHGITSNFILTALRKNGKGRLISIDDPSYFDTGPANKDGYGDTLPPGKEPGWTISAHNRPYWELVLGRSIERLPEVLSQVDRVDIFVHDSEHTYHTMWGELNLAWDKLDAGGILICDNIDSNTSFDDFCRAKACQPLLFPEGISVHEKWTRYRFGLIRR